MKKHIQNFLHVNEYPVNVSAALLILRVVVGLTMLTHGWGKMDMLFNGTDPLQFPDPLGVGTTLSLGLTVFAEVVGSILLIAGAFTRFSAAILFFTMMVAAVVIHGQDPFQMKEMAILYALIYLVIFLAGSGKYALDYMVCKVRKSKN